MGVVILVALLHRWDRCEQASEDRQLPMSSVAGQARVLHCPKGTTHTHHRGSVSVSLALFRVLVWFNPQPYCHGSKEASGARAPSVAAAACPGQGPAPPEGFVPPGMGVGQALALWRLQLLWLQPPVLPGKVVCKAWCAEPQLGNVLLPWRSLCLSIMSSCTHALLSYLSGENSFTYDLAAQKGMGQLPFA